MSLSVAVLSMHTSPLVQPGTGDGGGMNVYVRELSTALARAGVTCDVFTRADGSDDRSVINVEPGFRVHNVSAGPNGPVAKEELAPLTAVFADAVEQRLDSLRLRPDLFHANYWLSGVAGHTLKHRLDVPLVATFHTLARVKSAANDAEPEARALAEESIIGCTDIVLANTRIEADQLQRYYGADASRIEEVPLGVDHAFFSPGNRRGAKAALGLPDIPIVLYVGRIQPLKGTELALRAFAASRRTDSLLIVIGGPSGVGGEHEVERIKELALTLGVAERVRWVDPQPHHLLSTYYRASDVCVVPSRSESFGLVALEAGSCGTPVLAANVGGLQTIVDHGVTGLLIDDRDPMDWALAIDHVLNDPGVQASFGAAASSRSQRYAWNYTAARLRRLYGDLRARTLVSCA